MAIKISIVSLPLSVYLMYHAVAECGCKSATNVSVHNNVSFSLEFFRTQNFSYSTVPDQYHVGIKTIRQFEVMFISHKYVPPRCLQVYVIEISQSTSIRQLPNESKNK